MHQIFFCSEKPIACFRVQGADAASFLQGQFSNDLRGAPGSAVYGLWLDHKGKVTSDAYVLRDSADGFVVVSFDGIPGELLARLERFVIADEVDFVDLTATTTLVTVAGNEAAGTMIAAGLAAPPPGAWTGCGSWRVFRGRAAGRTPCWHAVRLEGTGEVAPCAELTHRMAALGIAPSSSEQLAPLRLADGIAAVPHDIGPTDLPQEGGLEHEAISFTKGCFIGQEVMARLKNLGRVRRRLFVVHSAPGSATPTPPQKGTTLSIDARRVGELRGVAPAGTGWVGLAMMTEHEIKDAEACVADDGRRWILGTASEGRAW
jgi:folate-binding protein YgfZ